MGNAGWAQLREGNYDGCIGLSTTALEHDSTQSNIRFNIALAYALKGDTASANTAYAAAISAAERFGLPDKVYDGAIKDLLTYQKAIASEAFTDSIIQSIRQSKGRFAAVRAIFLRFTVPHLKRDDLFGGGKKAASVKIAARNSAGTTIWTSDRIPRSDLDQGGSFCYLKLIVPEQVLSTSKHFNSQFYYHIRLPQSGGAMRVSYLDTSKESETRYANIKLNIMSTPQGATAFLVPHSTWFLKFQGHNWQFFPDMTMDKYRVDSALTDTYTNIDETVYVVLFKLKNRYATRVHYTKPAKLQPVQTVNVSF